MSYSKTENSKLEFQNRLVCPADGMSEHKHDKYYSTFEIFPIQKGFGVTIGNVMRRVLISSIAGSKFVKAKIKGVEHEFQSDQGVRESVFEILHNISNIIIKTDSSSGAECKIKQQGPKKIFASDISHPNSIEILNPDQYLFEITSNREVEVDLTALTGVGYSDEHSLGMDVGNSNGGLAIDTNFSPIKNVSYSISNVRVSQKTDYEKLSISIETNGSISPVDAISDASSLFSNFLSVFKADNESVKSYFVDSSSSNSDEKESSPSETVGSSSNSAEDIGIDELDLSVRSMNCLVSMGITTLKDLSKKTRDQMMNIKNIGKKSIQEMSDSLAKNGLSFFDEKN